MVIVKQLKVGLEIMELNTSINMFDFLLRLVPFLTEIIALFVALIPIFTRINKITAGQRCQLRSEMLRIYYHNKNNQQIRQYELENFMALYEAYKALKGNSFIDKIHREVETWDVIT